MLGIHFSNVTRLEKGHFHPSFDVLKGLIKAFDVSADYFLNDDIDDDEVKVKDRGLAEKIKLIDTLEEEEKQALTTMIDTMLTNQKMRQLLYKAKEEPTESLQEEKTKEGSSGKKKKELQEIAG